MKTDLLLKDKRLINWLISKGITTQEQMREFLHPSLNSLNNPFLFKSMNTAVQIIKNGIKNGKKFVIVGDYDCDGISAATILYKYFQSQNALCDVYIPNRFEDGYGLNINLIDEIIEKSNPDILITVDLGISAIDEVDYLNKKGVKVIVTDHHEPQEKLPNCLIIDPKVDSSYPCGFLCGAGVAYKLVSALAGPDFANKYLDLVSIATIGDIVPLLGENRAIAKLGLDKLAKKEYSLLGLKLLVETLDINALESSDIYLKIVPRINSSGRMDNAKKVFDFFVSDSESTCHKLLSEILVDNEIRLNEIARCYEEIEKELYKIDVLNANVICVKGNFHEGVLGILASKIALKLNKPAIVFSKTKDGTFKGSGRSVCDINLHEIILGLKDYCIHFGGHKMALGLEISAEKYDEFILKLNSVCKDNVAFSGKNLVIKPQADIEINFSDINAEFINELNMLSPFGCENPKPLFYISTDKPISFALLGKNGGGHIKIINDAGANIVFFGGEKFKDLLKSSAQKQILLDLNFSTFKNKKYPQGIIKNIILNSAQTSVSPKEERALRLYNFCKYLAQKNNLNKIIKLNSAKEFFDKTKGSYFGNVIVATTKKAQNELKKYDISNYSIGIDIDSNLQNIILVSSGGLYKQAPLAGFKNILVLDETSKEELSTLSQKSNVFCLKTSIFNNDIKIDNDKKRDLCAKIYTIVSNKLNNVLFVGYYFVLETLDKLIPEYKIEEIEIGLLALEELNIISINSVFNGFTLVANKDKKDLASSKILNNF